MTRLHTGTIPTSTLAATARVVDGFVSMQAARQGSVKNDTFTHNDRSELTAATLGTDAYNYSYDNIGNRKTAQEAAEEATAYDANNLNQYTSIQIGEEAAFVPTFDADGNQTKVKTSTGIWDVSYNILNRPTSFVRTNADGTQTKITAAYDTHGRRVWKKVEEISADGTTATVTSHRLFLYRGYLQIASLDLTRSTLPAEYFILWDPTEEVATRPLAIQKNGTWYTYGRDLTKNICEVFGSDGYIKTAYTYTPYGAVTANGNVTQPIQWSSEYYDSELGLVYYNYRHYNSADGRWINQDVFDYDFPNLYVYVSNSPNFINDYLGLAKKNTDMESILDEATQARIDKEKEINEFIQNNASSKHPKCWRYRNCITLTLIIEIADPALNCFKEKIGHASMAIGQHFMDFGPKGSGLVARLKALIATEGVPYWKDPRNKNWDGKAPTGDITLSSVKNNINTLVKANAAVEIVSCVCKKEEGDRIIQEWEDMISSNPTYALSARQCASSIAATLKLKTTGYHFLKPESLYKKFILENRTNCRGLSTLPPYAKMIKGFGI